MSHELDSVMIYIHPPLAIIGYVFIAVSLVFVGLELKKRKDFVWTRKNLYLAWLFNFLGLVTGMFWAQLAWGAYWSWDPKETVTLIVFVAVVLALLSYEKEKKNLSLLLLVASIIAVAINIFITLGNYGIHSYGFELW